MSEDEAALQTSSATMSGMITKIEGKCQFEDCGQDATTIACGREYQGRIGHGLGCYCDTHARVVSDEGSPEYNVDCPNCGCCFGVN